MECCDVGCSEVLKAGPKMGRVLVGPDDARGNSSPHPTVAKTTHRFVVQIHDRMA